MQNSALMKTTKSLKLSTLGAILLLITIVPLLAAPLFAQQNPTLTSEGVSGDMDSKRRSPVLSVSPVVESGKVKILVDAYVAHPEYKHLPIQFDFYINRQFLTSQIRSSELPGPVGIDVSTTTSPLPFNYTVIARLLHPNREFTTVINGAVFASVLTSQFDCTLVTAANSDESIEYVANDVTTIQLSNSSFKISFKAESVDGDHEIEFSTTMTVEGDVVNGSLSYSQDGETSKTAEIDGTPTVEDDELIALTLGSLDSDTLLNCS